MKHYYLILLIFATTNCIAQTVEFKGKVQGNDDLDGIHVINKTSSFYGLTSVNGEFKIKANLNDTIVFSSILYKIKELVISQKDYKSKYISVALESYVNELSEVTLGRVLTGNLDSDVANMGNKKQINFADVGIPGYTGKPLTQSERRLKEAGEFKPSMLLGFVGGFSLPINPILNAISGRTKQLKQRVELENRAALIYSIKLKFADSFFKTHDLPVNKREEFLLFVSEQPEFLEKAGTLDLNTVLFLNKYYPLYLQQTKK